MQKSPNPFMLFGIVLLLLGVVLAALIYATIDPIEALPLGDVRTVSTQEGEQLRVTVADTPAEREQGLSGRTALAPGSGMLFVFDVDDVWKIWMKDMHIGIDIIWLAQDGTIIDIEQFVSPESYPATFTPRAPARYVLELGAGEAATYRLKIGDKLILN